MLMICKFAERSLVCQNASEYDPYHLPTHFIKDCLLFQNTFLNEIVLQEDIGIMKFVQGFLNAL